MGMFDDLVPNNPAMLTPKPIGGGGAAPGKGMFDDLVAEANDPVLYAQNAYRGLNITENDPKVFMADLNRRNLAPDDHNQALNLWADQQVKAGRAKSRQSLLGRIGLAAGDALTTAARSTFVGPWLDELEGKALGEQQGALARANNRAIDTEAPVISTVGQLGMGLVGGGIAANMIKNGNLVQKVGGVALGGPLAAVGPAEGFLARRVQNLGTGAVYGANYGAGNAEDGHRLEGATEGAATGALTAGVLDAATGGLRQMVPTLTPQGRSPMADKIESRLRDTQAFRDIGTDPFAPALGDQGTARLARTVEAMPVIGRIVESPKTATLRAGMDAQDDIIRSLQGAGSDEEAGLLLQSALERQRQARLKDMNPSAVRSLGIEPYAEASPEQQVMSRGQKSNAAQAAAIRAADATPIVSRTTRGVPVGETRPYHAVMPPRRSVSDLSDDELQAVLHASSKGGSIVPFATRQEAAFENAYRKVPEFRKIDDTANPSMVPAANTRVALRGIENQIANDISGQNTISGDLADRIRDPQAGNFKFQQLRDIRTEIGRRLGEFNPIESRLDRSQLKTLYGAVSRDIENALIDFSNKARIQSKVSNNRPDYIPPDVADRADSALRAFRTADRYTRASMFSMDRFSNILGAKSPEQAARMVGAKLRESTSDFGALRAAFGALNPEERQKMAGYVVSTLGRGRPGGREAEASWNFTHFATDWERMGPRGQDLLLSHIPEATRRKLTALSRVALRMKDYENTRNFSNTAYAGLPMIGGALFVSGLSGFFSTLASLGTAVAVGKFLTSKVYLKWLTTAYGMGHAGPSAGAVQKAFRKLRVLAGNDKEFGGLVLQAIRAANIAGVEDPKKY